MHQYVTQKVCLKVSEILAKAGKVVNIRQESVVMLPDTAALAGGVAA